MLLLPIVKLGLWNAWLFMTYVIVYNVLPYFLPLIRPIYKEILEKAAGLSMPLFGLEKALSKIMFVVFIIPIVYSFFLPFQLATVWFYVGSSIFLLGVTIGTIALFDFLTTEVDKLVTKGVYRISRNPIYLGMFLIYIGTGIACASWLFLLLTVVFILLSHILVRTEERFCLNTYGDSYRTYLQTTPRWIGIPKLKTK